MHWDEKTRNGNKRKYIKQWKIMEIFARIVFLLCKEMQNYYSFDFINLLLIGICFVNLLHLIDEIH